MDQESKLPRPSDRKNHGRQTNQHPGLWVPLAQPAEAVGFVVNNSEKRAPKHDPQMAGQIFPCSRNVVIDGAELFRPFHGQPDKRQADDKSGEEPDVFQAADTPDQPAEKIESEFRSQRPIQAHDWRLPKQVGHHGEVRGHHPAGDWPSLPPPDKYQAANDRNPVGREQTKETRDHEATACALARAPQSSINDEAADSEKDDDAGDPKLEVAGPAFPDYFRSARP